MFFTLHYGRNIILAGLFICAVTSRVSPQPHSYVPKDGFVPDAHTAIRIAEAVWIPIYGEQKLKKEKPFHAQYRDDHWIGYRQIRSCRVEWS